MLNQLLRLLNLNLFGVVLPQEHEGMKALAERFLTRYQFEQTDEMRRLFGGMLQHTPESEDRFIPGEVAKRMRKQIANRYAYYLIRPDQADKDKAEEDATKAQQQEAASTVASKA